MIHEDFRSKLKESLYNSLILIVTKPLLYTWSRHDANPPNIVSNKLLILERIKLGEMTCKEIDTRKLYFINFCGFILLLPDMSVTFSLTDWFLGYQ